MNRLRNPVRHYAWGSGSHIPKLIGADPAGLPWAELWLGAHEGDPSLLEDGRRLSDAIAADPTSWLGDRAAAGFGRLPFLMKLLAAGEPLSLQVHPSSEQARLGYAAEEAARIPIDAPHRSYKDSSHKPELIYALTRFEGMAGFRDVRRSAQILRLLELPWLDDVAQQLETTKTPFQALRAIVTELLSWHGDELAGRLHDLSVAAEKAEARLHAPPTRKRPPAVAAETVERESLRVFQQTQQLVARYPRDPGVVVTLLLNHVVLAAGEAMYVPAGMMHAYTSGFGVEIMASSDNVLRAGLTPKHVDVPELLRITDFDPAPPPRWTPNEAGNSKVFCPPVSEFELTVANGPCRTEVGPGPLIVLAVEGRASVRTVSGHAELAPGDAVFTQASHATVEIRSGSVAAGRFPR
ncbi:mannose-6-phosphate isomerase, class I [Nocardioides aestuarii]|uniref:mannose-6-phosphate isomerase n=1 Tax=Nocardioides aestuarii TaxID=252231 RepID=A0ABW4TJ93_9ACTN